MSVTVIEETNDENENNTNATTEEVCGEAAVGEVVSTPYGEGRVVQYRDDDGMYVVRLVGGATSSDDNNCTTTADNGNAIATLFTKDINIQTRKSEVKDENDDRNRETVELNAAYGSFEKLRRLNFEIKCFEAGIQHVDHTLCTTCVLTKPELQRSPGEGGAGETTNRFPRLQKFVDNANAKVAEVTESVSAATATTSTRSTIGTPNDNTPTTSSNSSRFPRLQKFVDTASSTISEATAPTSAPTTAGSNQNANSGAAAKSRFPRLQKFVDTANATISEATTTAPTTTSAAAAESTSFPRLKKLWGTSAPPAATSNQSEFAPVTVPSGGNGHNAENSSRQANDAGDSAVAALASGGSAAAPPAEQTSFPRLKSLWNSTSSTISSASTTDDSSTHSTANEKKQPPKKVVLPRIQKLLNDRDKAAITPCLVCAAPTCPQHASAGLRREGITLCLSCERFFELDFIIDCVSEPDPKKRAMHIDHMVDLYDRCLLLLKYSAQYIDPVASVLEQNKTTQNKINVGSSGVGIVSGVLGVAAAATILTPAGPPLLIASLVFGGGATAVQTGTEAVNYFSEPNKLADRIIALHGMIHSLLRVTGTLRDAMLRDHIRTDAYVAGGETNLSEQAQKAVENNKAAVLGAANMGRGLTLGGAAGGTVAAEAGVVGARGATAVSRAGTAAARTLRFARFAGGALSAAVLVMEANAIQSTLKSINAGNPCEKADAIRSIGKEFNEGQLPTTTDLDEECQAYLSALEGRRYPESLPIPADGESCSLSASTPTVTAVPIEIVDTPTVQSAPVAATVVLPMTSEEVGPSSSVDDSLCAPGATIVAGEEGVIQPIMVTPVGATTARTMSTSMSPLPSIPPMPSLIGRIQTHRRQQQELRQEQRQRRQQRQQRRRNQDINNPRVSLSSLPGDNATTEVQDNELRDNDLSLLV